MNNQNLPSRDYYNSIAQSDTAKPEAVFIYDEWYVRAEDGVLRNESGKALELGKEWTQQDGTEEDPQTSA